MRALYLVLAYLLGGVPFGLIICKVFKKIDIRKYGSGNIGATNVGRVVGKKYAVLVFVLDGCKNFFPVLMAKRFCDMKFSLLVLFAVVIGHVFSFWLKGKGGKGISSTMLGLLALDYKLGIMMMVVWLVVFTITKISAVAALFSVATITVASYFILGYYYFFVLFIMSIVIFFAHRKNIRRLLEGKELGFKN
ncbi:MAG: glycerol-3-phosphate 1-O-acyltransferase PlsY [Rickettsiales bacterium]|jgi:glycerol-3-phosphate acyltransferase PlsY|nr:glycerol-3-phosphate 1-O-acyltransferase PlsY [Rickettsiales bacterium]